MDNKVVYKGGLSICDLLLVVFITLKLTHTIDWSWWWVFAPLWIPFAIVAVLLIIIGIIACFD